MARLQSLLMPLGVAILVIATGWGGLAPRVAPTGYRVLLIVGALLVVAGIWLSRHALSDRGGRTKVRLGAGAVASVGLAAAILLMVNFASARYHERWDLTSTKSFSLHPRTREVIAAVDREIDIHGFVPARDRFTARGVRELLDLVHYHQPLIEAEVVDPNLRPDLVEELGVRGTNVTVVTAVVEDPVTGDPAQRRVTFAGHEEEDLAAALVEVTRTRPKVVYWVQGHKERRADEQGGVGFNSFVRDLRSAYYDVRPLSLAGGETVPDDASLLVFADPRLPLPAAEVAAYNDWLRAGGRALVLADVDLAQRAGTSAPTDSLTLGWGLRAEAGVIIDPRARTGDPDPLLVVGDRFIQREPLAALSGMQALFRLARPISFFETSHDRQVFHLALVRVDRASGGEEDKAPYVETDLAAIRGGLSIDPAAQARWANEPQPAVMVAAYREFQPETTTGAGWEARLVLAGDADFLTDAEYDRGANAELAMSLVRWLGDEEILIRRETEATFARQAMVLEAGQQQAIRMLALVLPAGVFLCGWIVWFVRRSK
jgi:hypothetical protein